MWLDMAQVKRWGYGEDMLPSNHSVKTECRSTDMAETLINGITYGKGSAFIKQLIYLIDWETFCNGLKKYFKVHAWSNTDFNDFMNVMSSAYN